MFIPLGCVQAHGHLCASLVYTAPIRYHRRTRST